MKPFFQFWHQAVTIQGTATPLVMPQVVAFVALASVASALAWYLERAYQLSLALAVAPYEIIGAVLGLLLVLRTNAGYDRWWEARRLWGGLVNQCRNLAVSGTAYGPADPEWRRQFVGWVAAFAHASRGSLRGEREFPEVAALLGSEAAESLAAADHAPTYASLRIAATLREAIDDGTMDHFTFVQADRERSQLLDHLGSCERILKTPLPLSYSVMIRRFLILFLGTLPFGLLAEVPSHWLIPLITAMVAYPLLSLDQIGIEIQNPFSKTRLNSLPLDDITGTIDKNLRGLLDAPPAAYTPSAGARDSGR